MNTASSQTEQPFCFYLITTPGLEEITQWELALWYPNLETKLHRGGVEVTLPLSQGLALNSVLKTPNRVLVRLADFGCRDFPKLFKKISNIPWQEWLPSDAQVEFHASTHHSRLKIKKRIEETCCDGYRRALKKHAEVGVVLTNAPRMRRPAPAKSEGGGSQASRIPLTFEAYIRFEDDVCTLSLDTSGEILHKRGLRPLVAEAPLRETIASALLLSLLKDACSTDSSWVDTPVELVDPMMGGGTFLLEASQLLKFTSSRNFAFENWKPEKRAVIQPKAPAMRDFFRSYVGYEQNPRVHQAAQENLSSVLNESQLTLIQKDFFTASPLPKGVHRWLVANPPYGERIKVQGSLTDYYVRLLQKIEDVVQPERACLIFPEKVRPQNLDIPRTWRILQSQRFQNGGLPVVAMTYARLNSRASP